MRYTARNLEDEPQMNTDTTNQNKTSDL